ncbi:AAA family ATPase [Hymenobacter rubripertinctus]|uniref:AAA family ATPase n=1 Tax=Hymenobacter rubripertinctus TaxID=2029981 RepID=UPI001FE334AC|nr:AAA family ATPase [Hymenobacter rubripertinctus]
MGFIEFSIVNYEILLVTDTGNFILDGASGGISAIIDLSWQIYNVAQLNDDYITVVIDEIENHLHATMQRSLLPDLIIAFPNVQFIVSTHSPLIIGSVKDSNVYALRYNDSKRIFSQKLDLLEKARTANEILDEVLGVPFTMPIWVEKELNDIVDKYIQSDIDENSFINMRRELKEVGLEEFMPMAMYKVIDMNNKS